MLKLDNISLAALAPPSIVGDKNVKALINAINPELNLVRNEITQTSIYARIDELPENLIDLLAWQWHVDFYELANNLQVKRDMVKNSIEWHRHKGTSYAIIKALEILGVEAKFTPWYEMDDDDEDKAPYTFAIDAKLNNEFWERVDLRKPTLSIRKAIVEAKAARSYTSKIFVHFEDYFTHELGVKITTPQGFIRRVNLNQPTSRLHTHRIYFNSKNTQTISARMVNPQFESPKIIRHKLDYAANTTQAIFKKEV